LGAREDSTSRQYVFRKANEYLLPGARPKRVPEVIPDYKPSRFVAITERAIIKSKLSVHIRESGMAERRPFHKQKNSVADAVRLPSADFMKR